MGVFIEIEADIAKVSSELTMQLTQICPVDIFDSNNGKLIIKPEREDECILCGLCLQTAPPGALSIHKLYSGETMVLDKIDHND